MQRPSMLMTLTYSRLHDHPSLPSPMSVMECVASPRLLPAFDVVFRNHTASSPRVSSPRLPPLRETLLTPTHSPYTKPVKRNDVGIKLCSVHGCAKRAKAGGVCIAHGGGIRCAKDGCAKHAVSMGHCISHGGGKRCTVLGCHNASRKYGVCWSHGGKRMCLKQGCTKGPKTGGYCWAHGGKAKK
ncbi:hypothetical protein SDRG_00522 [Saprolegnia diclina VS20]|uniref:WRKY19-like zinc finger domain-containing protein n=1 Tax=Saprolegnia diclina (strain VS20) TaxID=1156394 RepID=T0R780_SAPDV|nr:hypothetical protein SDRG_00522 [Saprolegnia diclina VS20]EQC42801.1 hypothetical protein SDRG_00522 [Saprolegnia diclina VS20]|eukprot:XP_008604224.1 hypothetical protein SDRG_00522 [Saprolegnia diclina VS20]